MARVYSLVCWGGAAGKSVTVSNTTDLVTLTNHGLRNATGVAFTSGTLPTVSGAALALNTTYYAKSISSSTYELYYDSALTSKIDFTSTGSSLIMKSAYYLGLSDKSRWTTAGVERIYDGIWSWNSGRSTASSLDEEVCEIGQAFIETGPAATMALNVPAAVYKVETKVAGVRSEAFHYGDTSLNTGYVLKLNWQYGGLGVANYCEVEGFIVQDPRSDYRTMSIVYLTGLAAKAKNIIAICTSGAPSETVGIQVYGTASNAESCVAIGFKTGFYLYMYGSMQRITNCIATKNGTGFSSGNTGGANGQASYIFNNISLGNTLNWYNNNHTNFSGASWNMGLAGEAWNKAPGVRLEVADTSPFGAIWTDWTNNVLTPAGITSPQVETGGVFYGFTDGDCGDDFRPAYSGSNYNTEITAGSFVAGLSYTIATVGTTDFTLIGASANTVGVTFKATGVGSGDGTATLNAKPDIGAFEFDLGYGAWPLSTKLTFNGVQSGSEIRIYRNSDGTEVAGVESCDANHTFTITSNHGASCTVRIVNLAYRIKSFNYTLPSVDASIPVEMEADKWYSNPA